MRPFDLQALSLDMARIALEAGAEIMAVYEGEIKVEHKEDNSPLTEADQRAETLILNKLREIAPDIPIVSEEAAADGYIPDTDVYFFLVDPLDGTKEFIKRNGEFTVNVALIENGRPIAGAVYAPAMEKLFYTVGEEGAYLQMLPATTSTDAVNPKDAQKITVRTPPECGLTVIASRSHRDPDTDALIAKHKVAEVVSAGSSLKFCLVAAGNADFYPRLAPTMEWDTAAGHAVLLCAGGSVTTMDGEPLAYRKVDTGYKNPQFLAQGLIKAIA